jgi:hypothetical protein
VALPCTEGCKRGSRRISRGRYPFNHPLHCTLVDLRMKVSSCQVVVPGTTLPSAVTPAHPPPRYTLTPTDQSTSLSCCFWVIDHLSPTLPAVAQSGAHVCGPVTALVRSLISSKGEYSWTYSLGPHRSIRWPNDICVCALFVSVCVCVCGVCVCVCVCVYVCVRAFRSQQSIMQMLG